jgi:HEPN domain-containing protein
MSIKNPEQFKEWKERADEDLGSARILLKNNAFPAVICYHAHQVIEKYLKGYLAYNDFEFEKIHKLDILLADVVAKIDKDFQEYKDTASSITDYYFETRYPADFKEDISLEEAREAVEKSSEFRDFVLSKVELS